MYPGVPIDNVSHVPASGAFGKIYAYLSNNSKHINENIRFLKSLVVGTV